MLQHKVLLASQSPRRRDLLQLAGIRFRTLPADVDETYHGDIAPQLFPEHLALLKATAVRHAAAADEIIIAADTIVLKDGIIYGKPADRADAIRILRSLSGNMHEVITGVCLMNAEKQQSFSALTKVYFHPLADEHIAAYVDRYQPYDKAGAYAIQEWIGATGIEKIEGCYFNVMGLPISRVWKALQAF